MSLPEIHSTGELDLIQLTKMRQAQIFLFGWLNISASRNQITLRDLQIMLDFENGNKILLEPDGILALIWGLRWVFEMKARI